MNKAVDRFLKVNHARLSAEESDRCGLDERVWKISNMSNAKSDDAPGQNKEFTIFVNGRQKSWNKKEITFDEVAALAFGEVNYESFVYTTTYSKGEDKKPKGSLTLGESVHIKEGMVFDVLRTDKS